MKKLGKRWLAVVAGVAVLGSLVVPQSVDAVAEVVAPQAETYQIKRGDTLYSISRTTGVPIENIATMNSIKDVTVIRTGDILKLAAGEGPTAQENTDDYDTEIAGNAAVLQKIAQESPDAKYQKALQGTVTVRDNDGTEKVVTPSPYQHLVSDTANLTPDMINYYMQTVDLNVLNQEFGKLLNEARTALGSKPLEYMPAYQPGANIRATELATVRTIYVNNVAHTRLDGKNYDTAYDYLGSDKGGLGENLTGINYRGNPYELVSERYLATMAYTQWINSPNHKANQENPEYDGYALSIVPINNRAWSDSLFDSGYIAALVLVAHPN